MYSLRDRPRSWFRIPDSLGGLFAHASSEPPAQNDPGKGRKEYEARSRDHALALCADALRPGVARVEVRIGRDLAAKTNPEEFRRRADQQARAFVRDGRPVYALSVDWADLLDPQDRIFVRLFATSDTSAPTGSAAMRKLTPKEQTAIKEEIVREFRYSFRQNSTPGWIAGVTLICRDAEIDFWLRQLRDGNLSAWTDAFRRLTEQEGGRATPSFCANYLFEEKAPRTDEVGAGRLIVTFGWTDTPAATGPAAAGPGPRPGVEQRASSPPSPGGTYEIGDEEQPQEQLAAWVTWAGLGADRIAGEAPVRVPLPGVVNRNVLRLTSLQKQDEDSLCVVSDAAPLELSLDQGCLAITGRVKHGRDGIERPTVYFVSGASESALVGRRRFPSGRAELLIGGESHRVGTAPNGKPIRPVRILVALESAETQS